MCRETHIAAGLWENSSVVFTDPLQKAGGEKTPYTSFSQLDPTKITISGVQSLCIGLFQKKVVLQEKAYYREKAWDSYPLIKTSHRQRGKESWLMPF